MIKKILILFLILMPVVLGDLSEFPRPFVVDHQTDGLASVMSSKYVAKHAVVSAEIIYGIRPIQGDYITRLDTEMLDTYQDYHLLLIGNPCQNMIVGKVLGSSDCSMGLGPGESIIKLVDNGDRKAVIVAGYDFDSLRDAGLVLANYRKHDLSGDEYKIVPEQIGGERVVDDSKPSSTQVSKHVGPCDGCVVAQSCLEKGETVFGTYCDGSQMVEFKANEESCSEDYECVSGNCSDGKCGSKSFFQLIIGWLKSIFGVE